MDDAMPLGDCDGVGMILATRACAHYIKITIIGNLPNIDYSTYYNQDNSFRVILVTSLRRITNLGNLIHLRLVNIVKVLTYLGSITVIGEVS